MPERTMSTRNGERPQRGGRWDLYVTVAVGIVGVLAAALLVGLGVPFLRTLFF